MPSSNVYAFPPGINTTKKVMVETDTQTSPVTVTDTMPATMSTPTKERMLAPDAISPIKSCRGIEDPDYKPSDCSFNAEGEEIEVAFDHVADGLLQGCSRLKMGWWLWRMYMSVVETLLLIRRTLFSTANSWNCSSVGWH